MIGSCFSQIINAEYRDLFLAQPIVPFYRHLSALTALCGWGRKPSGQCAVALAYCLKMPYFLLEDGFLRSTGLGVNGSTLLSIVVDDLGIYYDARYPSRLEKLIQQIDYSAIAIEAERALNLIRQFRLSKYNHAAEWQLPHSTLQKKLQVLVIDQTRYDLSVKFGGGNAQIFNQMLTAAIHENPDAEIWLKTHPDVLNGKKQGYLTAINHPNVLLINRDISPLCLLEQIDKVYVVSSQMGFEALMLSKPVICFGLPWYAAWGLTDDRHPNNESLRIRRGESRHLEALFAAAYLLYPRYVNPKTGKIGTIFDVIEWLIAFKKGQTHDVK